MTNQQGAPEALDQLFEKLEDCIYEWSNYVRADDAPTTLPKYTAGAIKDLRTAVKALHAALVEAQQPAPSAAAPVGEAPLPLLVRDIAADLGTTPIQVCTALAQLGFGGHSVNMVVTPRMAKSLRAHFASPTPHADSQPAPSAAPAEERVKVSTQPICNACGAYLMEVKQDSNSYLSAEQFDADKLGDWYCIGAGGVSPLRNAAQETEATHLRELAAPSTDQVEEILRERDDADDFIDALLDEVLGPERPEWSSAYGRADALNDVRERMTALHKPAVDKAWDRFQSAMEAPQQPAPSPVPAGWKLVPVEPTEEMLKAADDGDDAYTLRSFGPGVQRVMQGPYDHYCAMLDAAPTAQADTQPAPTHAQIAAYLKATGAYVTNDATREAAIAEAISADRAARAPADSVLEDAARLSETPKDWRDQFTNAVYADLAAADNQDLPLEEYPARILKVLDSIVGPRHPTVIHWRNDAIQACIAIAYKYCRDPQSFQYLKQDLQALIFAARAPADSVTAPAGGVDDAVDAIALARYKVVPAHESMFHRFAVVAGDGKRQLYIGREIECANMARKFAGAFLDGAFYQSNSTPTPPAQAADSVLEDAARYRWLAAHCRSTSEHWGGRWSIVVDGPAPKSHDSEDDFDAAVDAARKQGGAT